MTCTQIGCKSHASYRFTWPGKDEAFICDEHARGLRNVAQAMGLHVQLIALTEGDKHTRGED